VLTYKKPLYKFRNVRIFWGVCLLVCLLGGCFFGGVGISFGLGKGGAVS